MRQEERKGAWTLLIAILIFGAMVWGYGGRKFREDKAKEETEMTEQAIENVTAAETEESADSIGNEKNVQNTKAIPQEAALKSSKKNKSGNKKTIATSSQRDILSDTIKCRTN